MKSYFKILQCSTWIIFMGILVLPFLNERFDLIEEVVGNENRKKAKKPNFDVNKLDEFTKAYDKYYTDNFNLRDNFIEIISEIDFNLFNVSPVPNRVTVGNEGWLYATKSVANYKAKNLFSPQELKDLKLELKTRSEWAVQHEMKYYLALVPNKISIYPEYLPRQIIKVADSTRYDQLIALNDFAGIEIINVRKNILKNKKGKHRLYQITDDHWNHLGAYYGYQAIMNRLSEYFTELEVSPLDQFTIETNNRNGNLAGIINVQNDTTILTSLINKLPKYAKDGEKKGYKTSGKKINNNEHEFVKVNSKGKKLKLLIIRDSFTLFLIQFFQENFQHSVYIHDEWLYRMREDILEQEKPDIVVNVLLETYSKELLTHSFVKTAGMYYRSISQNKNKLKNIKVKADKGNVSVDYMIKKLALWLFHDHQKKGKRTIKTFKYYEYMYEVDDKLKKKSEAYSIAKEIDFIDAVKALAKLAYQKNTIPKTVNQFYHNLTTKPDKLKRMKLIAEKKNIPFLEVVKKNAIWLYHDHWNRGEATKETLMYYEFLFEVNDFYKKRAILYAKNKEITFIEAIKQLSISAFSGKSIYSKTP